MSAIETKVYADAGELAAGISERFVEIVRSSIAEHGRCVVALAGGSTPKRLYQLLASPRFRDQVDWSRLHLFLGDERYVPGDHAESNVRMAREALLDHVPVPPEQVYPVPTDLEPADAAQRYEQTIRAVFKVPDGDVPSFDLILLGIGGDGHTASLFPDTSALEIYNRLVVENWVPQQDAMRISFSIPLIQAAGQTILMATGEDKADAVYRALEGESNLQETPSQILRDSDGAVTFALDTAAAARLTR